MLRGYVYAILSAVIFGCSPLAAKYVYQAGLNPFVLTFYRNFLALPVLYVLMRLSGEPVRLSRKTSGSVLALAVLNGVLTQSLLFSSYLFIPSGVATSFHFIYPTAVVAADVLLFRQKARLAQWVGLLLCTAGVLTFYAPGQQLDGRGCALALLSGITYAGYILFLEHRNPEGVSTVKVSFYIAGMVSIVLGLFCGAAKLFVLPPTPGCWAVCILYALGASVIGIILFQKGTARIGGQRASILSAFEPITSVLIGVLVFHEAFGWRTALGTGLVIAATVLLAAFDSRSHTQPQIVIHSQSDNKGGCL